MVRLIVFCFAVASLTVARADDTTAREAIEEAITTLNIRKLQAADPAEASRISDAVVALQKLQGKDKPEPAVGGAKNGAKKLSGHAVYNAKTHELTVAYDFRNPAQLADFTQAGGKIAVKGNRLILEPGQSVRHVAKFTTVTVMGVMDRTTRNGGPVSTSSGVGIGCLTGIYFRAGENETWQRAGDHPKGDQWRFKLVVEPQRAAVNVEGAQAGSALKTKPAGQITFSGGEDGNAFSRIVLSGEVDSEWAAEFFKQ